ncbi:Aldedh domain-containing protein [Trichophyton interdigitale]|uniref:aldehyde dehydrogenase (NAD(+)) n=1 Tax=Trichophyton equinum (strain ATCC MYA-4606 / CBS 127.97) TaxID=559882 RepID=F2PN91_TRIEC|nr:betaine aldehyde dehydrogenase [Trichophyton equinum CBS 127.97]KAG5205935.1 Aldedh domain-containing protein [Trichophyton interdigitale]KAG5218414.1 Aldedh domain-containing protein [Trichophyton interdigitale]KAG8206897.1 Aldedh domain-containing protein [Trichophyton interdigitale]
MSFKPQRLYYDGQPQASTSNKTFQSVNPATEEVLADVAVASNADVDQAVKAAQKAFPAWSRTPHVARARILLRAVQLLRERNDEIARVETADTGKPFSETSTVDVTTGADVLEYFASMVAGGGLNGETVQLRDDAWVYTKKAPLGVCAGIGAWNYPIQIALWKSAPCLAAGNTMVYKPSEFTPLHGEILADLYTQAGLPAGVFNVVHGAGDVGAYLTAHPAIAKVSFTGQVATGKKVAGSAAGGMKYVTMELGGKSPFIVLPDADLDSAVDGAILANFFSTGQVCTNGTRVFVPSSMKADFESLLLKKMQYVRAGDVMDPATNFGPLVSDVHYKKVTDYIRHGIEQDKAKLLYGGLEKPRAGSSAASFDKGYWITPTIFTDCRDEMKIVQEEIFGPVMSILYYETVDEVVRRANETPLGLAAGVFTQNINLAHRVIDQLEAGITWINSWGESPAEMSVGGWKQSGVGVENGRRGIEAWVRTKSTLVDMSGVVATSFTKL